MFTVHSPHDDVGDGPRDCLTFEEAQLVASGRVHSIRFRGAPFVKDPNGNVVWEKTDAPWSIGHEEAGDRRASVCRHEQFPYYRTEKEATAAAKLLADLVARENCHDAVVRVNVMKHDHFFRQMLFDFKTGPKPVHMKEKHGVLRPVECLTCGQRKSKMSVCKSCGMARYCDRSCQAKDWAVHRDLCALWKLTKDTQESL
jgi:hypothetical protein